jgi:fumarylacetoacetase
MSTHLDQTHELSLTSWVESANDPAGDFSIQNLPLGVFAGADGKPRIGTAIGDRVLDLAACAEDDLLEGITPQTRCALCAEHLNELMAQGRSTWRAVRSAVSALLHVDNGRLRDDAARRQRLLHDRADVRMLLPAAIGDYTDFYASIHHATNVGSMFRPDNPLMPNYRHLPVGYHGRASSIVVSGTPIRRPCGQVRPDDAAPPTFGACRLLDYELEMGLFVGQGNALGSRVPIDEASQHMFGLVIVNDWSARDVQKWEYQPLGPFNAKNFATTISPWIVTAEALAPFRVAGPPRGADDPPVLEYLSPTTEEASCWGLDITVEATLSSPTMRERGMPPVRLSHGSFRDMYWTLAQMLVHHSSTGCNTRPGDLIASGTVSGPDASARGCLLELTWRGRDPVELPDGTQRKFLQDGDEVTIAAWCEGHGAARVGFGTCTGVVEPATP